MGRSPTALSALAASIALALAGCGSGGREDTTASSQTPSSITAPASNGSQGPTNWQTPSSTQQKKEHKPDLPPPTPGSKAAAPGVPTSKHGDNSIQTWGLEASDAQREAATDTVQRYLGARAAGDWAKVCSLLAVKARHEQGQFAGGASCAKAMASLAADASPAVLEEEADIEVLSFRLAHKYSFLIYRRPDGIWATALTREEGNWRLISVTPNPIS